MKQKTNKPTTSTTRTTDIKVQKGVIYSQLSYDLKSSLLIVSVAANLFVMTAWIALQVTSQYDSQISSFLFTR